MGTAIMKYERSQMKKSERVKKPAESTPGVYGDKDTKRVLITK